MSQITQQKFETYNRILETEKNRGLKDYMIRTISNLSIGELSYNEVKEIRSNYTKYEKQFQRLPA
jgi:hypothetical protein